MDRTGAPSQLLSILYLPSFLPSCHKCFVASVCLPVFSLPRSQRYTRLHAVSAKERLPHKTCRLIVTKPHSPRHRPRRPSQRSPPLRGWQYQVRKWPFSQCNRRDSESLVAMNLSIPTFALKQSPDHSFVERFFIKIFRF